MEVLRLKVLFNEESYIDNTVSIILIASFLQTLAEFLGHSLENSIGQVAGTVAIVDAI
jgi:hypothetical protein